MDELIVECLNRPSGCEFTCQRHLLAAHLKDDCLYVEAPCPDPECPKKALRKDILRNNDVPRCPHCLIICDGCGTEMKAAELGVSERTTDIVLHSLSFLWHAGIFLVAQPGLLDRVHSLRIMRRRTPPLRDRLSP